MSGSEIATIRLAPSLGVSGVEVLREQFLDALNAQEKIEVDISGLEDIDVSAIQLLISAHKTAIKLNRPFRLVGGPNGALTDALVRGGFMTSEGRALVHDGAFWV